MFGWNDIITERAPAVRDEEKTNTAYLVVVIAREIASWAVKLTYPPTLVGWTNIPEITTS